MKEETKRRGRLVLRPLVNLLVAGRVAPNTVTIAAVPLSIGAAVLIGVGQFIWGGVLVALVGLCDTLDGEVSRLSGRGTRGGAFLDSVVDRFSEAVVFAGLFWYYRTSTSWYGLLVIAAAILSLLVSYVRARAEGAGFECKVGWFERPIRVMVLLAGLFILGRTWAPVAIGLIAFGSLVTVIHRLVHVLAQEKETGRIS